jgi:malate dehydrogenase
MGGQSYEDRRAARLAPRERSAIRRSVQSPGLSADWEVPVVRAKITVVGAGNVGATLAQRLAERDYADIVLVDIVEGLPQGKALDMLEAGPIAGYDSRVTGTNGYQETAGSDIVVITSGLPRKPGMSRDDLVMSNAKIVAAVTREVVAQSPECVLIVVSNPVDGMAQLAMALSGFPRERVIGMGGVLDTARFRTFLAQELDASVRDVQAYVLGGHGDTMVPLTRLSTVAGVPAADLIAKERLESIVQRARDGGAEIVNLLKSGSAYYAPSAAVAQMVDAILLDTRQVLPCTVYLTGEYGVDRLFTGVPCRLGAGGLVEVVDVELTGDEREALHRSAEAVRQIVEVMEQRRDEIDPGLGNLR